MSLTLKEAALYLKTNPEVLRRNLNQWGVPYVRLGRRYRFTQEALQAYLNGAASAPKEESWGNSCIKGKGAVTSTYQDYALALGLTTEKKPRHSQRR